jgi:TolA-binding protein
MKGRMMKLIFVLVAVICTVSLLSCSADKASELFETAQFEELQNNNEHARQIYEDIIKKYPGSDSAKKAEDRLTAIGKTKNE